jgi:hypothetical protein
MGSVLHSVTIMSFDYPNASPLATLVFLIIWACWYRGICLAQQIKRDRLTTAIAQAWAIKRSAK